MTYLLDGENMYYCHECAKAKGLIENNPDSILLDTPYQLEKYIKHVAPSILYDVNSVFLSTSTGNYGHYFVDSLNAGAVEIDGLGRKNILFVAGEQTGVKYKNGEFELPTNSIKVVLSSDVTKTHLFPESSTSFEKQVCSVCGRPIVV